MEPIIEIKYFLILAIAILAAGLSVLVYKWPKGIHHTFSQHAATNRRSILFYIALFTVVLPLLLVYFLGWLIPTHRLPATFTISLVCAIGFQYLCTLVPEVGSKARWHVAFAGVSAVCLFICMIVLTFALRIHSHELGVMLSGVTVMVAVAALAIHLKSKYALVLQVVYFAAFFLPLVALTM